MKKLLRGIIEFRRNSRPDYREKFGRLAAGQSPDTLMIACSDSRVVPNLFASTDPGDLFVVRNVGNLVPSCREDGVSTADESEAAAIEFSLNQLGVSDIIVCGHSECGAVQALLEGRDAVRSPNLKAWLRHGEDTQARVAAAPGFGGEISPHNRLSQLNVLCQLEHLMTYPIVRERVAEGKVRLHAWWFELGQADVYAYEEHLKRFVLIDEEEAARIMARLDRSAEQAGEG